MTGGGSGIGRAAALRLAREGAAVAIVDRNETAARAAAEAIVAAGGRALVLPGDVTSDADCRRAVEETTRAFGGLAILFNNAGITRRETILEIREADWDRVMEVNVKAIFLMSRAAIPVMRRAGSGSIINTASGWGLSAGPKAAAYCASKGAVVQLTRAMAVDHGPEGIRVNCICPGDTDTPLLRNEAYQLGEPIDQFLGAASQRPLRRVGTPEEIAEAVLYLASDDASFVNGAALIVDGGGQAGSV